MRLQVAPIAGSMRMILYCSMFSAVLTLLVSPIVPGKSVGLSKMPEHIASGELRETVSAPEAGARHLYRRSRGARPGQKVARNKWWDDLNRVRQQKNGDFLGGAQEQQRIDRFRAARAWEIRRRRAERLQQNRQREQHQRDFREAELQVRYDSQRTPEHQRVTGASADVLQASPLRGQQLHQQQRSHQQGAQQVPSGNGQKGRTRDGSGYESEGGPSPSVRFQDGQTLRRRPDSNQPSETGTPRRRLAFD